jgi:hypothetical protein
MSSRLVRPCLLLVIAASAVVLFAPPARAQLFERMYGYRPRVYGYYPSAYVFPRYGFHHGEIYARHIGYGEPGFGQRGAGPANPAAAANAGPACPADDVPADYMGTDAADAQYNPEPAIIQP